MNKRKRKKKFKIKRSAFTKSQEKRFEEFCKENELPLDTMKLFLEAYNKYESVDSFMMSQIKETLLFGFSLVDVQKLKEVDI